MPTSWNTVIFKFRLIFATDVRRIVSGEMPSIRCFGEAHWSVATKETQINGLPQNTIWNAFPYTILCSSVAKIKRNLKMTVFQEMGIESKLLNQIARYWKSAIPFFLGHPVQWDGYDFQILIHSDVVSHFWQCTGWHIGTLCIYHDHQFYWKISCFILFPSQDGDTLGTFRGLILRSQLIVLLKEKVRWD